MDAEIQKQLLSALISVGLVLFGWFLGQGTTLVSTFWKRRKTKKALETELADLLLATARLKENYRRDLQFFGAGAVTGAAPLTLSNRVFSTAFADISIYLNHAQRQSYDLIHQFVGEINDRVKKTVRLAEAHLEDGAPDEKSKRLFGEYIYSQFVSTTKLIWHIQHHLDHKKNPSFYDDDKLLKEFNELERDTIREAQEVAR